MRSQPEVKVFSLAAHRQTKEKDHYLAFPHFLTSLLHTDAMFLVFVECSEDDKEASKQKILNSI